MIFRVKDQIWKIRFVEQNSHLLTRSDGSRTFGVTDNNTKTVYISNNLSTSMEEHVICHELTHCICFTYVISIPLETEEWICNFMADHGKEIIYLLDDILRIIVSEVA